MTWDPHMTNKTTKRLMKLDRTLHNPSSSIRYHLRRLKAHPYDSIKKQKFNFNVYLETQLHIDLIYLLVMIVFVRDKVIDFVKFRKWPWWTKGLLGLLVFIQMRNWLQWTYQTVHTIAYLIHLLCVIAILVLVCFGHTICLICNETTRKALNGHILEVRRYVCINHFVNIDYCRLHFLITTD